MQSQSMRVLGICEYKLPAQRHMTGYCAASHDTVSHDIVTHYFASHDIISCNNYMLSDITKPFN